MVYKKIRLAGAYVLGMIPLVSLLSIHFSLSFIFKYLKKYKFLDLLDLRINHIGALSMELWLKMVGIKVYLLGDERSKWVHQPTLILSNHCNVFDSALLKTLPCANFQRGFFYHNLKDKRFPWIEKMNTAREQYIAKNDGTDSAQSYEQHLKKYFFPMYQICIMYPEGGIYKLIAKKSEEYARANNIPSFKHLALPRIKGIKASLDALAPTEEEVSLNQKGQPQRLKWVADLTLFYSDEKTDVVSLFQGVKKKTEIFIHTKIYDIDEIPRDSEQLKNWVYQRFREKDRMLEDYKVHGKLPTNEPPTQQSFLAIDFILFNALYLFSLYNFLIVPFLSLVMKCF